MSRCTFLFAGAVIVIAFAAAPARADSYVSAGVGTAPSLGGDFDGVLRTDGHSNGKISIGQQVGPAALEAGLGAFGVTGMAPDGQTRDGTALNVSVAVSLHIPLVLGVGGYARGGLERSWIGPTPSASTRISGDGYLVSAGLEYGLDVVVTHATIWAEANRDYMNVSAMGAAYHGTADMFLAGLRIGI